jgi:hypothetical protein
VVSVTRDEMEHNVADSDLVPIPFPFTGQSSSFPAAYLDQPHQEDLPPPFSEVDEGRGVQALLPPSAPAYSKRPRPV